MFLLNTTFLGCVYQLNITYLNIALMFLSYTLLFYFLYDISFKTALFHSLLFLIVMFATEIITSIIGVAFFDDFNALEKNISAYVFVTVISKLLYFSIMKVILKFYVTYLKARQTSPVPPPPDATETPSSRVAG